MKEATIVRQIMDYLKRSEFWVMKVHGSNYQRAGVPDLLAIKNGQAYWFEVKTPDGKVSRLQEITIEDLRRFGSVADVVRSVEDVKEVLRCSGIE